MNFKYKVIYGYRETYAADEVKMTKSLLFTTETSVSGDDITRMIEILEPDEYVVYIYNAEHNEWVDIKDVCVQWKPIHMKDIIEWNRIMQDYLVDEEVK